MTEPRTTCDLPHPHGAEYRLVGTECPWHDWTLTPTDGDPPWNRVDPWFTPKAWALEKAKRQYARRLNVPLSEVVAVIPAPTKKVLDQEATHAMERKAVEP